MSCEGIGDWGLEIEGYRGCFMLELEGVVKGFGGEETTAVASITLSIKQGEILCLLGPSGCGKTTLLRLIAGLELPDSGDVLLNGDSILPIPPHLRGIGMMFQDFALFPHKNVQDNITFGLKMRGDSPQAKAARAQEMLALVDLTGFGERQIDNLSGGEKQRVALARALAARPNLLLLDEPLGALDRALRERLMLELGQILRRVGVTAVYVTHDQTEAFAIADRVAVMNAGKIEQVDTPEVIYTRPATPFVARFLGRQNLLPGRVVENGRVETGIGRLPTGTDAPLNAVVTVLIKPDKVLLSSYNKGTGIEGRVTAVSFRGRYYQIWVQIAGHDLMFELPEMNDLQEGQLVQLAFQEDAFHILR